jgi:hypothetical protein
MESYEFTKTPVDIGRLDQEIRASSITIALDHINMLGVVITIFFKAALSADEQTTLSNIVSSHNGEPLELIPSQVEIVNVDITSTEKAQKVATTKLEGSSSTLVSHNFCDRTTWWTQSVRVLGEQLNSENNLVYTSAHLNWIDLVHGKVAYEDRISSTYAVKVYVNSILITSGYSIDYSAGAVTFEQSQEGNAVTADYSYENGSRWAVSPSSGKMVKLIGTQVKVSDDVSFGEAGAVIFQPYLKTGSPAGSATIYKSVMDLLTCVPEKTTRLQKFGEMTHDMISMDYSYITSKDFKYSQNVEVRIWLSNNKPISGSFAYITAHIISLDEV